MFLPPGTGALTDIPLLQPRERLQRLACRVLAKHGNVAVALHRARWTEQLNGNHDESDHPKDEQHKGADHDNGRQQALVEDEPEYEEDVDDEQSRDGDKVGKVPGTSC